MSHSGLAQIMTQVHGSLLIDAKLLVYLVWCSETDRYVLLYVGERRRHRWDDTPKLMSSQSYRLYAPLSRPGFCPHLDAIVAFLRPQEPYDTAPFEAL